MLYLLADQFHAFNVFRYITVRSGGAVVTALLISFSTGPTIIAWLKSNQGDGQPIRTDGPQGHLIRKKGTPTMGGFLILLALTVSTVLWADLVNPYVWIVLAVTVSFGLIGFFDDYRKLARRSHHGLPGRLKLLIEIVLAVVACVALAFVMRQPLANTLAVPFFKNVLIDLGWFFVPFGVLVITGASNSVNLTDGLDGLAIGPTMIAAGAFAFITYLVGNAVYANYLQLHHVPRADELMVF
jgi:phospho-N-acetylmuramoyl-pentapeptide-transferase